MRLICPNCDAQYEVSDDAIPSEGRDVQCSNCGHGWFQRPDAPVSAPPIIAPEVETVAAAGTAFEAAPGSFPAPEPFRAPRSGPDSGPESDAEPDPADETAPAAMAGQGADEALSPVGVAPPSRSLDRDLLAMLREEAEREAEQRRKDGFAAGSPAEPEVSVRPEASMVPAPPAERDPPVAQPVLAEPMPRPRRDLLPDIEEINSTLRSGDPRPREMDAPPADPPRPSRGPYRAGFFLMVLAALMLAIGYLMAPRIAAEMPGAEPALRSYVAAVDEARLLLDRLLRAVLQAVQGAAA